jgi:hypothetical protein
MFIKTWIIVVAIIAIIFGMIFEWQFAEGLTSHYYHGLCNAGVGLPYRDFVHQLHSYYESGDTNALGRALRGADERRWDISRVWLDNNPDAYRTSIQAILH